MGWAGVTTIVAGIMVSVFIAAPVTQPAGPGLERPGVCEREWPQFVDDRPVRAGRSFRAPRKLRDVKPVLPEVPPRTVGRGLWVGEYLIDLAGKVAHVWPTREIEFTPPSRGFNDAIVEAIRHWEFEPPIANGQPAPMCMTATVSVDWQ